jgi:hypothetical protein
VFKKAVNVPQMAEVVPKKAVNVPQTAEIVPRKAVTFHPSFKKNI